MSQNCDANSLDGCAAHDGDWADYRWGIRGTDERDYHYRRIIRHMVGTTSAEHVRALLGSEAGAVEEVDRIDPRKDSGQPETPGDVLFLAILDEMRSLHLRKSADYDGPGESFANIRTAAEIGIEPWRAAWFRAKDKVKRIDTFCLKGTLQNEGVEDSFLDLASYALIALRMFREAKIVKDIEQSYRGPGKPLPR